MKKYLHNGLYRSIQLLIIGSLAFLMSCQKTIKENSTVTQSPLKAEARDHNKNNPDVAVDWYNMQLRIILNAVPAYSNIITIRLFGFSGISLYESVHYIIPHSPSLHSVIYQMPVMPQKIEEKEYIWQEVVNATMASVTRKFFPTLSVQASLLIDSLENAYNQRLMESSENGAFARSQSLGRDVVQAVFNFAQTDLFSLANAAYTIPVFPGAWVKTLPVFANPATPYLGNVRPFIQSHSSGLAAAPAFSYSTDPTSDFYKMIKDLYDVSKSLTTDQSNMAIFWNDVGTGKGYTPSGHAINILNHVIVKEHMKIGTAVQAYLKAGMGMWDAAIMCWRSKYAFNMLRPVSYIRTNIDPEWLPLIPTPPHPEYPAAHAYITTATMVSIASVIGDKHYIDDHTYDFLGF
ncbi:MAG TPA: hypothetical protein VGO09_10830, partial [Flavisolibacter sp.]|nr:hypothetical protein [Flavisolibacter sp.]